MKPKVEFSIRKDRDELVFSQRVTKRMKLTTSLNELKKMQMEKNQLQNQLFQVQKQIDNNELGLQVEAIQEQLDGLSKVEEDWQKLITPVVEELRKKIKKEVKKAKKEKEYDEVEDKTRKIILQNEILAPILEKVELEMGHPLVMEIKREFDSI